MIEELQKAYHEVQEGKLPDFPSIEWYIHSTGTPFLLLFAHYVLLSSAVTTAPLITVSFFM